jgi:hypothetical protein
MPHIRRPYQHNNDARNHSHPKRVTHHHGPQRPIRSQRIHPSSLARTLIASPRNCRPPLGSTTELHPAPNCSYRLKRNLDILQCISLLRRKVRH